MSDEPSNVLRLVPRDSGPSVQTILEEALADIEGAVWCVIVVGKAETIEVSSANLSTGEVIAALEAAKMLEVNVLV